MAIDISFGGANIKRPGAYSMVDSASMYPTSAGGFKVLAFVGVPGALSTLPADTVSYFNNPITAQAQIVTSELLDIMQIAWAHGADLIAVSPVAAVAADLDWQNALDLQAKVDAHCTLMSSIKNRRERRGWYGHPAGLSVSTIAALQAAIPAELGLMATPEVYTYDSSGEKVLKGSHYLAAAYAGIWASQVSQEPITYKYVKFPGLGKIYDGTEIETLLAAHIAPTEYVRNKGYRIVQGVTMSPDEDLTKQELSVSSVKEEISQTLRDSLEAKYVGKAGEAGIEVTVYNDYITQLESFITKGLISGYDTDTVQVVKSGTSFILQAVMHPTLPINNFLLTSHLAL